MVWVIKYLKKNLVILLEVVSSRGEKAMLNLAKIAKQNQQN